MNGNNQITIAASILALGLIVGAFFFTQGGGGPSKKTFDVVMENNRYNPSEIVVNLGDEVVINFMNKDAVSHAVGIEALSATVPGDHVPAGGKATMQFLASKRMSADAAVCGGPVATDKTDDHGEELIVTIL